MIKKGPMQRYHLTVGRGGSKSDVKTSENQIKKAERPEWQYKKSFGIIKLNKLQKRPKKQ